MRRWLAELRALAWPLLGYWAVLALAFGLFAGAVVVADGPTPETLMLLGLFAGVTGIGVTFGQLGALTRLRLPIVVAAGAAVSFATFLAMGASAYTAMTPLAVFLAVLWLLFPFFAVSGLLSLRTSTFQIFALFSPIVYVVGAILTVSLRTGGQARWFAGEKWAIWDLATAPLLLAAVAIALVYLAARERHRLHRWATALRAPEDAAVRTVRTDLVGASFGGCGTLAVGLGVALVLAVGTGALAPFLWRSAPADEGEPTDDPDDRDHDGLTDAQERELGTDPDDADTDDDGLVDGRERRSGTSPTDVDSDDDGLWDGAEQPNGTSPTNPDSDGDGLGDAEDPGTPSGVPEVVRSLAVSLFFLVLMSLLTVGMLFVFGPPFRRSLMLHLLRRPPATAPPSDRIHLAWRITEIALGDLGVERFPGDSASALARRALPLLPRGLDTSSIVETAGIADRTTYGLGVDPLDEERARRHAEMAYQAVWDTLPEGARIRAIYRWDL